MGDWCFGDLSKAIELINGRPRTQIQHCPPTDHGQTYGATHTTEGWRWVGPTGKRHQGGPFLVYITIPWIDFVHCQTEFITNLPCWPHSKIIKIRFLGHLPDVSKCLDIFLRRLYKNQLQFLCFSFVDGRRFENICRGEWPKFYLLLSKISDFI